MIRSVIVDDPAMVRARLPRDKTFAGLIFGATALTRARPLGKNSDSGSASPAPCPYGEA